MPTIDEIRTAVLPRRLMCAPGVVHPKNDVLFVQLRPPPKDKKTDDWYATLPYGRDEVKMAISDYVAAYIEPLG